MSWTQATIERKSYDGREYFTVQAGNVRGQALTLSEAVRQFEKAVATGLPNVIAHPSPNEMRA
jgi:hypothetical protein